MSSSDILTRPVPGDVPADLGELRARLAGTVASPDDPDWDLARQAWNLAVDQPVGLVARPADAADVQLLVRFAAAAGLRVAPQSTGHNAPAFGDSLGPDVLLVRLDQMRRVTVDPVGRRARAEAGAWWGDVTPAVGAHGLVALAGSSPDVGVAGYTLGGGISWLARRHGLACNAVLALEVVTADGELVRCDATHEPELFWALRGGGGSFGVVTAIEMALVPQAEVLAGVLFFPIERAREVLQAWAAWTASVPDTMTSVGRLLRFPPVPEVPEPLRGGEFAVVEVCFLGDARDGDALVAPLRALGPAMDTVATIPATGLARLHMDPEGPTPGFAGGRMLAELPAEAVDAIVDLAGPGTGSPLLSVEIRHLGGALSASSPDHGALDRLEGSYLVFAVAVPMDPDLVPAQHAALAAVEEVSARWGSGREYLNFVERPADAGTFFGPDTLARLQAVRAAVDPDGLFLSNHPIPAAG